MIPALTLSLVRIVLIPIALGVAINALFGRQVERIKGFLPLVATAAILAAIAIIVALNQANLAEAGLVILLAIILHNS